MDGKGGGNPQGEYVEVPVNEFRAVLEVIAELADALSQALDQPADNERGRAKVMLSRLETASAEEDGPDPGYCDAGSMICRKLWRLLVRFNCPQARPLKR